MRDYIIVGAGLYGAVFARIAADNGKNVLVVDRRQHIAGNIYTERMAGVTVHRYGAHIFHTDDEDVQAFIAPYARFRPFVNMPLARYGDRLYNLPFNMNTFYALWGVRTPAEARAVLAEQTAPYADITPTNLKEQALKLAGPDIYERLIAGYTEKQWGRPCESLPASIIRRLPFRFTFDNNYFNDKYQGIPEDGYTAMTERLLAGIAVRTGIDASRDRSFEEQAKRIIYTGAIDEYFDCKLGRLAYRSLRFETEVSDTENYQGNAVINYTDAAVPYTRIIEHKHFLKEESERTVITREYPAAYKPGGEAYYPVNDAQNNALYESYVRLAKGRPDIRFGGRLGEYAYLNMDQVVRRAMDAAREEGLRIE
ncbi:MAG: UDP-galactopyranose mutase [Eubacteriales bacterium]|nr:UDP-galactopyranose mutase [Eubacteriales bacterium]